MSILSAVRDVLPKDYIERILNSEYDAAIMRGLVEVFDTVGSAVQRLEHALSVLDAPEGAYATTTLRLTPTTSLLAASTVKAGSLFSDTERTRFFYLQNDTVLGPGSSPVDVLVTSVGQSHEYNCKGEYVSLGGERVPGTVVEVERLVTEPPFSCDVTVRQMTDATGGSDPSLQILGEEEGVYRQEGESAASYRDRLHGIPDTVSPDAFERYCYKALAPNGILYRITEGWQLPWVYMDADEDSPYTALDDTVGDGTICTEADLLSTIVEVVPTRPLADMGACLDDEVDDPLHDNVYENGELVASPCVDGDDSYDMISVVLDGEDTSMVGMLVSLAVGMEKIKAGGTKVFVQEE
jgi:hypothetical protein